MANNIPDSSFIATMDLQGLFRDKTSGEPLRDGYIEFYKDQDRTTPNKPVYKLTTDMSGAYTFAALPNPLPLSAIGSYSDGMSNDIAIYWFPYEGVPDDESTEIELYYIRVYDENDVFQFDREAWPPDVAGKQSEISDINNYIPNGQFLIHTDLPKTLDKESGEIREDTTEIAPGGWFFERPSGATSTDFVNFISLSSVTDPDVLPTTNPQYTLQFRCTNTSGSGAYKRIVMKFEDVNKFASESQNYTLYAEGRNNAVSGTLALPVFLIKNFGSAEETPVPIGTLSFGTEWTADQFSFVFGSNDGETISTGNYVKIAIYYPTASTSDSYLTNVVLTFGSVTVTAFPPLPDYEMKTESQGGFLPLLNPDGSDLYLPIRSTKYGFEYDHTVIGNIRAKFTYSDLMPNVEDGELACDGARYRVTGYSDIGIPYSRLWNKLYDSTLKIPITGTGPGYFAGVVSTNDTAELRIINNSAGAVTNTADGSSMTGFTFRNIHKIQSGTNYHSQCFLITADTFWINTFYTGIVAAPNAHTSGFTIPVGGYQPGAANLNAIIQVKTVADSSASLRNKYFTFDVRTSNGGGTQLYHVWFTVDGSGSDPAPGSGQAIEVDLTTDDSAAIVAQKIQEALNGWQISYVKTLAASTLSGGQYFTASGAVSGGPENDFYVWYTVDGTGSDPMVSDAVGIKVELDGTDTAAEVAETTRVAINEQYFAVPDFRGITLKGWNNGAIPPIDRDTARRWSLVPGIIGDVLGTFQLDFVKSHFHELPGTPAAGAGPGNVAGGTSFAAPIASGFSGDSQNTVFNAYVHYVILY